MEKRTVEITGLAALTGTQLGTSEWRAVTQDQIDRFANATGDHQWIHVDFERAATGPFGGTIAHGYLTLSLAPVILWELLDVPGATVVNYGLNKVRFPAPVPVGARIRAAVELGAIKEVTGGVEAAFTFTFEIEGKDKPACVAEVLYRYYA